MALSPHPWVALVVALVALVAPVVAVVAPGRQWCSTSIRHGPFERFRSRKGLMEVTNGGPWGQWGDPEFCPPGSFASGFQLKVHPHQGLFGDDTGLNGVRLLCDTGRDTVTSSLGPLGSWGPARTCPPRERLVSFRLRVEPSRGVWDDAAATDMAATCSGGHRLEGGGLDWGDWGDWSERCVLGCGVCGVRARVETPDTSDDSGLNDLQLYCCT
ncbi:vitelline membrane outer layer protein 1 homolog [Prinia subflava]|uniref:vitelline membrane outer layer protein 1 homolog n=1 Tax=Prinia subflava TaxID=208062 RepID=UPI002FE04198